MDLPVERWIMATARRVWSSRITIQRVRLAQGLLVVAQLGADGLGEAGEGDVAVPAGQAAAFEVVEAEVVFECGSRVRCASASWPAASVRAVACRWASWTASSQWLRPVGHSAIIHTSGRLPSVVRGLLRLAGWTRSVRNRERIAPVRLPEDF